MRDRIHSSKDHDFWRDKPEGGYCPIKVGVLTQIIVLVSNQRLKARGVRIWACYMEMRQRRKCGQHHVKFIENISELKNLLHDHRGREIKKTIHLLSELGMIPNDNRQNNYPNVGEFDQELFAKLFGSPNRVVPFPRHILRYIASSKLSKSELMALLVMLIRGLHLSKKRGCNPVGQCSTSCIASCTRFHQRTIKKARRRLLELGLIINLESDRWAKQLNGQAYRVNFDWDNQEKKLLTGRLDHSHNSPPRRTNFERKSPPLLNNKKSSPRGKNQNPFRSNQNGDSQKKISKQNDNQWNVDLADLNDRARLLMLFKQAHRLGYIGRSESDQIFFFSAAARSRRTRAFNPGGLFTWLIRGHHRDYITLGDEDAGLVLLNGHKRHAVDEYVGNQSNTIAAQILTQDARLVCKLAKLSRSNSERFTVCLHQLRSKWNTARIKKAFDQACSRLPYQLCSIKIEG